MKVKLAVIGSGFGLYGLLPAFQRIPFCEVIGICGKSTDRLVNYCRKTSVNVYSNWEEMLDKRRPDAIAVAVVPKYQYEIIKYAFKRGISVFAEKPLCVNLDQAKDILECARKSKLAHMVDFLFPEMPQWKKAKELLDQDNIGKVIQVTVNWSFLSHELKNNLKTWKSNPDEGGGALSFYFCHVLYNLELFLGKIENLYCKLSYSSRGLTEEETGVSLAVKFQSACTGNITFNCFSPEENKHSWEFQGERGSLTLENLTKSFSKGFELVRYHESGEKERLTANSIEFDPVLDERVYLIQSLGERFINWCAGGSTARPNFEDGFRVQQVIDCARFSFRQNKVVAV
jgi:predicted dehydrogenase